MSDQQGRDVDRAWFATGLLPKAATDDAGSTPELAERDPERYARVVASVGHFSREAAASVDPRRRAALCFEIGRIHEQELDDQVKAAAWYQKAISADPTHLPTLRAGRRLFGRAAQWSMVLRLLDAEIRTRSRPQERVDLLRQKAEIYLARFDEPTSARVCLLQALDFDPDDAAAARLLTTAAALAGDARAFARAAARTARAAQGSIIGRAMAGQAAEAFVALGEPESAQALLEEVLADAPDDGVTRCRLADACRRTGDVARWAELAAETAERIADPDARAARRAGIARIAAEAGVADRAIVEWEAVLADEPTRLDDRRRLARALEATGQGERAAAVWSRVADELRDPGMRLDALWRLADLHDGPHGDSTEVISALRRILDIEPSHAPAVRRLRAIATRDGRWTVLGEVLVHCIATAEDPLRAAMAAWLQGRIREERLDDRAGAVESYRVALERDPRSLPIADALAQAEAGLGDWRSHAETLEHMLTLHADPAPQVEILRRIADVAERRLGTPATALDAWLRLQALRPDDAPAARAIERLSATTDAPPRRDAARVRGPGPAPASTLWRLGAESVLLYLGDRDRATRLAQKAVEADPTDAEARGLLDALREPDDAEGRDRWRLMRVERAPSSAEAVPLLVEMAHARRAEGDVDGARVAWEQVLEREPAHAVALEALAELARRIGDAEAEAEALTALIDAVDDAGARIAALVRLGHVYVGHLDQPETGADAWQQALTLGEALDALHALRGLYERNGDTEGVAALLATVAEQASVPAEAVCWWMAVAEQVERLDEPDRVFSALSNAREADRTRVEPLLALERHHLARRTMPELAELYDELAGRAIDGVLRAELRLARARLAEGALSDLRMAFEAYEDVLADAPQHTEALTWMERWAEDAGDLDLLAEILERRLAIVSDGRTRTHILERAGRVLHQAQQTVPAVQCYEAALAAEPDSPVALHAIRALYDELGDRAQFIEATAREGRACNSPVNASSLLVEAGRARESLASDDAAALTDYRLALRRNPTDDEALTAVRRFCERTGRWADLAAALEERARAADDRKALEEAIRIHTDRLEDPRAAMAAIKRLVPMVPPVDVPPVLRQLADLYVELADWPAAIATYERLRTISPDAAMRRAIAFRLVAIFQDKVPDGERARGWLRAVLDADPGDVDALERLADVELADGQPSRARIALARAVNAAEPGGRRAALRRRIARMDLEQGRMDAALLGLEAAVEEVPDDAALLEALADACLDAGKPARARAVLDRALAVANPRSAIAERLRQRVAEAALAEGADPADLIRTLRSAVGERPDDRAVRQLLADALGRREEHVDEAIEQIRWLLARAPLDPSHLATLRRLLLSAGQDDAAGQVARLRVAAGIADEDDTRLLGGPTDGMRPLVQPLTDEAIERIWGEVDRAFVADLKVLVGAVPGIFGPRPPCRPGDETLTDELARIGRLVGGVEPLPAVGPLPVDMVQQGERLIVSERLLALPGPERAFFLASAVALGVRGVDVVTRWSPEALRRRIMTIALAAGHPLKVQVPARVRDRARRLRGRYRDALTEPKTSEALSGLVLALPRVPEAARAALSAAHRIGLLAAGGVGPATRALARTEEGPGEGPALTELARFAVSPAFAGLRDTFAAAPAAASESASADEADAEAPADPG